MRFSLLSFVFAVLLAVRGAGGVAGEPPGPVSGDVAIVVSDTASPPEQVAAGELARFLKRLYPDCQFRRTDRPGSAPAAIYLGTPQSAPELARLVPGRPPAEPEGFVVSTARVDGRPSGWIIGADPAGVVYGVYRLLRKLGAGFYLSLDTLPESRAGRLNFDGWQLQDHPLVPVRLVFNWHNFLSGCSTWNREHWQQWIVQSQKMGYNAVMVHAYGNNPMAGFSFRGLPKPVGYLSSTRLGRDWSTNHVNDVSRLWGGQVFSSPVFGSEAAIDGTDAERTRAAQQLMARAFSCAEARGVKVYFAVDVDTSSANPQELITRIPARGRFFTGGLWLANPDTEEGYRFYRAQVAQLLEVYPAIDWLVVWHRTGGTPWMSFPADDMPETWQREYRQELARTPEAEGFWHAHHLFALGKIVRAFQRAVRELGRPDVGIALGSWRFDFLPAADRFLPPGVPLIPLDWMVLRDRSAFDTIERRTAVARVAARRTVIPIAWAHHDDGNYVGRPYTPYPDFCDRLEQMRCRQSGFGIIHWMTRPLDLYFTSLLNQVWASTRNEPLRTTCRRMARDLVGPAAAGPFAQYLHAWVTTMPKIGRETSDFFIDHPLEDLPGVTAGHRERIALLDAVRRLPLKPGGRAWVEYFAGLEDFVLDVYRTEDGLNRARAELAEADAAAARRAIETCQPESVIDRFAETVRKGPLTRGEQGLIVTLNTRWLPHYVRFRQRLRLEPVRFNFAPTSHDPLAQSRGIFTFHFDPHHRLWQCWGEEETGAATFVVPEGVPIEPAGGLAADRRHWAEICRTGIESDGPIALTLRPILATGSRGRLKPLPLSAGTYRLVLLVIEPAARGAGPRVFRVTVSRADTPASGTCRFAPTRARYLRLHCRGNNQNAWNSVCELRCPPRDPRGRVTASGYQAGYEPANACDGNPDTRWAVEGRDHWIQFPLDPATTFDRLEIAWYGGPGRRYDFDVLVSDDGTAWSAVPGKQESPAVLCQDEVDVFQRAGGAHRFLALTYPIQLGEPAAVTVRLDPIQGKPLICGVVLEPDAAPRARQEAHQNRGSAHHRAIHSHDTFTDPPASADAPPRYGSANLASANRSRHHAD